MKFPEKYIKGGRFKLHSGQESDVFYDVNALITDFKYLDEVVNKIPEADHYVGIATGGAIIAVVAAQEYLADFSMIKDGELKGKKPKNDWILIDDVTTTESSLEEALKLIDSKPKEIFVVVDRRKEKNLKVTSVFEV